MGAIAAAPLVLAAVHVEGFCFQHEVDELPGLLAHVVVHGAGGGEDLLLAALGGGVALREDEVIVIEHQGLDSQLLPDLLPQAGHHGHNVPADILAELLHFLRAVAQAAHAVVAQLDEVPVAHLLRHPVADVDELVKQAVQLLAVGFQGLAQDLVGLFSGGPVGGFGVFHQHGPRQLFAPELELHARHHLGILADHLILRDHVLDDLRGHGFQLHLKGPEDQGDDLTLLFQLLAEGRGQHGLGVL